MLLNLNSTRPKARKEHICNYCRCSIPKGEVYSYNKMLYDGEHYVWKNHLSCDTLASVLRMHNPYRDEGLNSEDFREFVQEAYYTLVPDEAQRLHYSQFKDIIDYVKRKHFV